MKIITAHNICKSYLKGDSKVDVLKSIDFYINKGEILTLLGPSGTGKSTLLNILGTLDTDFKGELKIDNVLIKNSSENSEIR